MTRKHYVMLAGALRRARERDDVAQGTVDAVAVEIASTLGDDNPRFDRARFLRAAGNPEGGSDD